MLLNPKQSSIIRMFALTVVLITLGVFMTQSIGLFKGGLSESARWQYFIYYIIFPSAALVGIISLFIMELVIIKGDNLYGNSLAFNDSGSDIHLSKYFDFMKSPFKLFFISIILFGILGIYISVSEQSFIGVGSLPQQFTATDNLIFSTLLVTISENLGVAFWFALTIFGLRWAARKYNWSRGGFIFSLYISSLITFLIYGLVNHFSRYGGSDISLQSVGMFWILGGILTMITGSFIPFWVAHMSNNFFLDLRQILSNEQIITFVIIFEIILIIIFAFIQLKSRKKEELVNV